MLPGGGPNLQCRHILGTRRLVYVRIVVAGIFDFTTAEDWGVEIAALSVGARAKEGKTRGEERKSPFPPLFWSFNIALSQANTFERPKKMPCAVGKKRGTDFPNTKLPMGNFHDTSKEHANPL